MAYDNLGKDGAWAQNSTLLRVFMAPNTSAGNAGNRELFLRFLLLLVNPKVAERFGHESTFGLIFPDTSMDCGSGPVAPLRVRLGQFAFAFGEGRGREDGREPKPVQLSHR